jgi:Alg9-like mannosyltransferase family
LSPAILQGLLSIEFWVHPSALQSLASAQGLLSVACFARLRVAVQRRFGAAVGIFLMVITALQFHLPFYMSRTLPNVLALAPVTLALADHIERRRARRAIALLVFAAVRGITRFADGGVWGPLGGSGSQALAFV